MEVEEGEAVLACYYSQKLENASRIESIFQSIFQSADQSMVQSRACIPMPLKSLSHSVLRRTDKMVNMYTESKGDKLANYSHWIS